MSVKLMFTEFVFSLSFRTLGISLFILIQYHMGFEEFFENNRKYPGTYREQEYNDDNRYSRDPRTQSGRQSDNEKWLNILEKIRNNKKLKLFVVLAVLLILTIAIVLIIVLMPLITKLINYISQNGLQSIVESITGFLDKIWKGSAN
jgi:hypothetical protein